MSIFVGVGCVCFNLIAFIVINVLGVCLSDLLKFFVICLVTSDNSAIWSSLLVETESCKLKLNVKVCIL